MGEHSRIVFLVLSALALLALMMANALTHVSGPSFTGTACYDGTLPDEDQDLWLWEVSEEATGVRFLDE